MTKKTVGVQRGIERSLAELHRLLKEPEKKRKKKQLGLKGYVVEYTWPGSHGREKTTYTVLDVGKTRATVQYHNGVIRTLRGNQLNLAIVVKLLR